ncbi:E3 binding domain-containing protein [Streptomyces brasiliscabiei]|uniref:E3 binding domain-containing protein n=1 Tax=Streptomyces brasiliscabiei TaxID=2736302 RepID=A0ABU8GCJ8_9ACTN
MPSLGADMDEGTLLEWLVGPGDLVSKGDPVAVVETAKSTIEVECFESGTITELLVEPGATVPVGTPLALIGQAVKKRRPVEPSAPQSGVEAGPVPEEGTSAPVAAAMPAPVPEDAASAVPPHPHTEAGPLARHLAQRSGVDLETLCGSGPGGRVTRTDVEKAVALVGGHPARVRATPFARRLAAELGVDLGTVKATGRNPAVRAADVRRTAPGAPGVDRSTPGAPGAVRRTSAARTAGFLPVAFTVPRSTPNSAASRRANGVARTRAG